MAELIDTYFNAYNAARLRESCQAFARMIDAGATIGLRAVIMGGVEVGAKAKVLASSFVLPNTKIPDGETWAGIPARRIELERGKPLPDGANAT